MNQRVEQELKKHLAYDALLTALNQTALVSITDRKGIITYANDRFIKVSKYTRSELIGQNHRILKSGDQPDSLFVKLWKTISKGETWRGEIKNKAKDGSYYWVDTSITPIVDKEGKVRQYIAVRFEMTDKKLIEKEQEDQKQKLLEANLQSNAILESIADALITTDKDLRITMVNEVFEELTGLQKKDVVGKKMIKILELVREDGEPLKLKERPVCKAISEKKQTLVLASENLFYQTAAKKIPVSISVSPIIRNSEVVGTVEIFRDATQEKQIDRAKSEFVSLASHQLRTPLTAVSWYTDIVLAGEISNLNEDQLKYIREIQDSNIRMIELVNALLNVSRIDLGTFLIDPVTTNLVALCKQIVKDNEPAIFGQRLNFVEEYDDIPPLPLDPNLTRIVIENIITNAIKYTPQKGTVTLQVKKHKGSIAIHVNDTGYGIPKSQQDKIFTKLFRADNIIKYETEGTGLGLYIAKSVIEAAGGSMSFSSKQGKGSTFSIELPLSGMIERKGTRRLD